MDLNSKLPRTEVVVHVIDQAAVEAAGYARANGGTSTVDAACLEELGRVLAWCLLRDATNQTPPPK